MFNLLPAQLHEAAMGLHYLHEHGVVHGDLKGVCRLSPIPFHSQNLQDNILITNAPVRACLADFGFSTLAPSVLGKTSTMTTGGTPLYMAPELLNPEKFGEKRARLTQPADMYAFGMVIYEVLTGSNPFHDYDCGAIRLLVLISNGARPKKPSNAEEIGFGSGTWELVKECWKDKPTRRPTIGRVLAHLACDPSGMDILKSSIYGYLPSYTRSLTRPHGRTNHPPTVAASRVSRPRILQSTADRNTR